MKGVVEVIGLVLFERHGVHESERKHGQRFVLDLMLEVDVTAAVKNDRIADTVDYGEVAAVAESAFRDRHFFLIEACAAHVAEAILAHFPKVHSARVTVKKPSAPVPAAIDYVAATITATRKRDA